MIILVFLQDILGMVKVTEVSNFIHFFSVKLGLITAVT